jgi:Abnormal spindle-like microcephaly-assoc'd, ASPM-SPD-2-Hydin
MISTETVKHSRLGSRSAALGLLILAGAFLVGCNAAKSPSAGTLSASSANLNFGNVAVGSSKSMPLTLTNGSNQSASIQLSQVNISGSAFHASGVVPPVTLTPGQSVVLNVGFQPSAGGAANGSISIASTATNPLLTFSLSGTGVASGQLGLSPASMSFGSVNVGSNQSLPGTLTAGSVGVTVSSATWSGTGFSLSGLSFPVTLQAGQTVPFTVTFAPQSSGSASGAVSFLSNASNSPNHESWSGTGVQTVQHSVALNWNPDTSGVQGYYIYRGGQTGGPYTKISALQPGTTYTDTNVISAQTYYYVVTALGTNSVESGYSNEAVATIP